jgi:mono/diheme cytochrome c family protein
MKITFRILMGLLLSVILLWGVILFRFNSLGNSQFVQPALSIHEEVAQADLELGKRIYSVRSGCIDCHGADLSGTKVMDNSTMGSIYGANITPYNLKSWSDEEVAIAIRYGIHKTNRSLRFMPALTAYVRSVPSVDRHSHENSFGPMAKILSSLGQMPVMFPAHVIDSSKPFAEKPAEGATIKFGKYLASSCVGCHGVEYKGGKIPGGDPSWPEASNNLIG